MLDSNQHRDAYIQSVCEGLEHMMQELGKPGHNISASDAFVIMQITGELERRFSLMHTTGWKGFEDNFSDITDMAGDLSPRVRCAVIFGGQLWD